MWCVCVCERQRVCVMPSFICMYFAVVNRGTTICDALFFFLKISLRNCKQFHQQLAGLGRHLSLTLGLRCLCSCGVPGAAAAVVRQRGFLFWSRPPPPQEVHRCLVLHLFRGDKAEDLRVTPDTFHRHDLASCLVFPMHHAAAAHGTWKEAEKIKTIPLAAWLPPAEEII